jgi:hypothetical protein
MGEWRRWQEDRVSAKDACFSVRFILKLGLRIVDMGYEAEW